MSEELKPCPFCGGKAITDNMEAIAYLVVCMDCDATASSEERMDEATENWNTRPIEEAKDREIAELKEVILRQNVELMELRNRWVDAISSKRSERT